MDHIYDINYSESLGLGEEGFWVQRLCYGIRAKGKNEWDPLFFNIYIPFFIFNIDYIYTHTHIGKSYSIKRREDEEKKKNVISM